MSWETDQTTQNPYLADPALIAGGLGFQVAWRYGTQTVTGTTGTGTTATGTAFGGSGGGLLAASSSAIIRRMEARISSIEGSCAFAA